VAAQPSSSSGPSAARHSPATHKGKGRRATQPSHVRRSKPPPFGEGVRLPIPDNEVIEHADLDETQGLDQVLRDGLIR
jgi:hypothetical protein